MEQDRLYDHPEYYHLALRNDFRDESLLLERCFREHSAGPVREVLDIGCGTGRLVVDLVDRGYHVIGYDLAPRMVEFAHASIRDRSIQDRAAVFVGDMRACPLSKRFDAAINACEGLGYLTREEEIVAHFRLTAESIRPGGLYVVGITPAWEYPHGEDWDISWTEEEDGLSIRAEWDIEKQDYDRRLSHQVCRMEVNDHGRTFRFEDRHLQRLWYLDELDDLVRESARFELVTVYDREGNRVPADGEACGEDGYMSCVLRALK